LISIVFLLLLFGTGGVCRMVELRVCLRSKEYVLESFQVYD
jgi:hypothetical protein